MPAIIMVAIYHPEGLASGKWSSRKMPFSCVKSVSEHIRSLSGVKNTTFIILSAGPCSTVTWDFSVVLKLSSTKCNLVLWWWRSTHTGIYIEYFMSKVKSLLYIQCNHKPLGSKNILIRSWLPRLATLAQCIQPDRLKFPWDPSQIIVCPGTSLTL